MRLNVLSTSNIPILIISLYLINICMLYRTWVLILIPNLQTPGIYLQLIPHKYTRNIKPSQWRTIRTLQGGIRGVFPGRKITPPISPKYIGENFNVLYYFLTFNIQAAVENSRKLLEKHSSQLTQKFDIGKSEAMVSIQVRGSTRSCSCRFRPTSTDRKRSDSKVCRNRQRISLLTLLPKITP